MLDLGATTFGDMTVRETRRPFVAPELAMRLGASCFASVRGITLVRMDTSELLRRAWQAVEKSGVPESLHAVALQAAVEDIRAIESGGVAAEAAEQQGGRSAPRSRSGGQRRAASIPMSEATKNTTTIDENTFFAQLADESGVPEKNLRDVLTYAGGTVHVSPPTRELGSSAAEQARTVIALVAGARSYGLNERPVNADAVRAEVERKRCYQSNNFASKHLGPLRGFNAGPNRTEIVTNSRWVEEFAAAVNQALGRTRDES